MRILAYCLLLNHWHLLLWPKGDQDLWRFMHWLTGQHASFWRHSTGTQGQGAVYQARYTPVPVLDPLHLITVWRYIERNPIEAGLVQRAEEWDWSSASHSRVGHAYFQLDAPPWPLPSDWLSFVNQEFAEPTKAALAHLIERHQIERNLPGQHSWPTSVV